MESRFSVDTTIDADIQYEASKSLMPRYVQLLTWVCFGLPTAYRQFLDLHAE